MFSGFQPGLVEARQRPRLLSESDPGLELPQLGSGNNVLYLLHFPEMNYFLAMKYFLCLGCQADWAQLPRALPRHVARRREHRHRRGGRDSQVLERVQ